MHAWYNFLSFHIFNILAFINDVYLLIQFSFLFHDMGSRWIGKNTENSVILCIYIREQL